MSVNFEHRFVEIEQLNKERKSNGKNKRLIDHQRALGQWQSISICAIRVSKKKKKYSVRKKEKKK